jgi:hypothetical protein
MTLSNFPANHPTSRIRRILILAPLVILLHWGFGLWYSLNTPVWEGNDETAHVAYIAQLHLYGTFPSDTTPIVTAEQIQPPAYYLLLSGFYWLSGTDVSQFAYPERNPYFYYGTSGLNYVLHPLNPTPIEKANRLMVRVGRFFTLLLTLIGVAFAYQSARRFFRRREKSAYVAALLFALWPIGLFHSGIVSNDSTTLMLGPIITWVLLGIRKETLTGRYLVFCLCLIGISSLFKLNLLVFIAPLIVAVLFAARVRFILLGLAGTVVMIALITLLLSLTPGVLVPFLVRGYSNETIFEAIFNALRDLPETLQFSGQALVYLLDSAFALFGWGNVPLPAWANLLWRIAFGILIIAIPVGLFTTRTPRLSLPATGILFVILIGLLIGALILALFYISIHLVPGRYLLPGLTAFAIFATIGLMGLGSKGVRGILTYAVIVALIGVNLITPMAVIARAYALPPTVRLEDIPNRENVVFADGVRSLGWNLPDANLTPGEEFTLELFWQADYPLYIRYYFKIEVIGPDGYGYGLHEAIPGGGVYLATDWVKLQPFKDTYKLRVRRDFPAPAVGRLRVTVLPQPETEPGQEKSADFGRIVVRNGQIPEMNVAVEKSAIFRDSLLLRRNYLELPTPTQLWVDLTWQRATKSDPLPTSTMFVHVLCIAPGCPTLLTAQQDQLPRDGSYPLEVWQPEEALLVNFKVKLPDVMRPGQYAIRTGLYDSVNRWVVEYAGTVEDGLLIGWLFVDEENGRKIVYTYPIP